MAMPLELRPNRYTTAYLRSAAPSGVTVSAPPEGESLIYRRDDDRIISAAEEIAMCTGLYFQSLFLTASDKYDGERRDDLDAEYLNTHPFDGTLQWVQRVLTTDRDFRRAHKNNPYAYYASIFGNDPSAANFWSGKTSTIFPNPRVLFDQYCASDEHYRVFLRAALIDVLLEYRFEYVPPLVINQTALTSIRSPRSMVGRLDYSQLADLAKAPRRRFLPGIPAVLMRPLGSPVYNMQLLLLRAMLIPPDNDAEDKAVDAAQPPSPSPPPPPPLLANPLSLPTLKRPIPPVARLPKTQPEPSEPAPKRARAATIPKKEETTGAASAPLDGSADDDTDSTADASAPPAPEQPSSSDLESAPGQQQQQQQTGSVSSGGEGRRRRPKSKRQPLTEKVAGFVPTMPFAAMVRGHAGVPGLGPGGFGHAPFPATMPAAMSLHGVGGMVYGPPTAATRSLSVSSGAGGGATAWLPRGFGDGVPAPPTGASAAVRTASSSPYGFGGGDAAGQTMPAGQPPGEPAMTSEMDEADSAAATLLALATGVRVSPAPTVGAIAAVGTGAHGWETEPPGHTPTAASPTIPAAATDGSNGTAVAAVSAGTGTESAAGGKAAATPRSRKTAKRGLPSPGTVQRSTRLRKSSAGD